jgi:hypothetical protein
VKIKRFWGVAAAAWASGAISGGCGLDGEATAAKAPAVTGAVRKTERGQETIAFHKDGTYQRWVSDRSGQVVSHSGTYQRSGEKGERVEMSGYVDADELRRSGQAPPRSSERATVYFKDFTYVETK